MEKFSKDDVQYDGLQFTMQTVEQIKGFVGRDYLLTYEAGDFAEYSPQLAIRTRTGLQEVPLNGYILRNVVAEDLMNREPGFDYFVPNDISDYQKV